MPRYLCVARQTKEDGSACTEADLAAQHKLLELLQKIHPCAVMGEEMSRQEQEVQQPVDGLANRLRRENGQALDAQARRMPAPRARLPGLSRPSS